MKTTAHFCYESSVTIRVKPVGTAPLLEITGTFYDPTTRTLTVGVALPKDEAQARYSSETAPPIGDLAGLSADPEAAMEPLAILGQGDTARHISP